MTVNWIIQLIADAHRQFINLNPSDGAGEKHPKILTSLACYLAAPLAKLFNNLLETGIIPLIIYPIYRKGSKNDVANYRHICISSAECKVLERILKANPALFLGICFSCLCEIWSNKINRLQQDTIERLACYNSTGRSIILHSEKNTRLNIDNLTLKTTLLLAPHTTFFLIGPIRHNNIENCLRGSWKYWFWLSLVKNLSVGTGHWSPYWNYKNFIHWVFYLNKP